MEHLPQDILDYTPLEGPAVQLFPQLDAAMSLEEALEKSGGNKAKAARLLGVSRCTIYRRMNEFPLPER